MRDSFLDQQEAKELGIIPIFGKSSPKVVAYKEVRYHYILENLLSMDKSVLAIGLVRNPLAVINSWLKAPKEFRGDLGWRIEDEWRCAPSKNLDRPEEYNGFEKWKEVTYLFHQLKKKFGDQFVLLNYGDLISNTQQIIEEVFSLVGLKMNDQVYAFINESTSRELRHPYSVYRTASSDDKWKSELPGRIRSEIEADLTGTELEHYLR